MVSYVIFGDLIPQVTVPLFTSDGRGGVDVIELVFHFRPMADGPRDCLSQNALAGGTNTLDALNMVKKSSVKGSRDPVVLMGYLNPVEVIGYEKFVSTVHACGVDGILLVDLPPEEAAEFDVY